MSYRWAGSGPLRRSDEPVEPGEEFEPTDAERESFGDLMDPVEESGDADDKEAPVGQEPEGETCQTVKSDGEVCGRDLPCPYHTEDDGEE